MDLRDKDLIKMRCRLSYKKVVQEKSIREKTGSNPKKKLISFTSVICFLMSDKLTESKQIYAKRKIKPR